jgi:hypothetical protein
MIVPESGSEVSPLYGHINAFPLPVSPTPGPRHWPVQWSKYDGTRYLGLAGPSEVFDAIQKLGAQIIQANHPRGNSGVFDRVGFDAEAGTTREPLPPYDAFEVMNGAGGDVDAGLRDLVGIIRLGRRITGTGTGSHVAVENANAAGKVEVAGGGVGARTSGAGVRVRSMTNFHRARGPAWTAHRCARRRAVRLTGKRCLRVTGGCASGPRPRTPANRRTSALGLGGTCKGASRILELNQLGRA